VVAAELRRLGYPCIRTCGQLDGSAWVQPGKGQWSPELFLDVRFTADVDRNAVVTIPRIPAVQSTSTSASGSPPSAWWRGRADMLPSQSCGLTLGGDQGRL
jgi:hypothetical protein